MPKVFPQVQTPQGQPRLTIVAVAAAVVLIALASLYMVQMPGDFSSMLASMLAF